MERTVEQAAIRDLIGRTERLARLVYSSRERDVQADWDHL